MPIHWDSRNKRWRFTFNRVIAGRRHRASRLLPRGWSQAQADAFDRKEAARLYAVATGIERSDALIDTAVLHYLTDKQHLKSHRSVTEHLASIAWAYMGKPLSELPAIAAEVVKHETARGMAPATIRQRLALLKAAGRWAWKQHALTEHDPTGRMQLPQVNNQRRVYFTRGQMLALAWASKSHAVRILLRTSFYSGLRLGELARVEVDGDVLNLADTKNGEYRSVPAHPKIRTCLPYLPLSMPRSTLHKYLKAARAATGLEGTTFHTARHSTASELINAGEDLYTVGQVLGHKDPRSSARYAHLTARRLKDAIGKIGRKDAHKERFSNRRKAA